MVSNVWKASGLPLTAERLRKFVHYDPQTGQFRWLVPRSGQRSRHPSGIGSGDARRNRALSVDGKVYSLARLAWLYAYGDWPKGAIYHQNGDGSDDRIDNLVDSSAVPRRQQRAPMDANRLKELTTYDPETGNFYWKRRPGREGGHTQPGQLLGGYNDQGYQKANIDGRAYRLHRLAWLYMMGAWPKDEIDHANGDRADNRWSNIRAATRSENARTHPGRKIRSSPLKGVYKRANGRWCAQITLGVFDTPEEAHEAYMRAARLFFGEFARSGPDPSK